MWQPHTLPVCSQQAMEPSSLGRPAWFLSCGRIYSKIVLNHLEVLQDDRLVSKQKRVTCSTVRLLLGL